jgi:hypothetical protein
MDVLAPNHMGNLAQNTGIEAIVANTGHGAAEATGVPLADEEKKSTPANPSLDPQRRAAARQFGVPMKKVGF